MFIEKIQDLVDTDYDELTHILYDTDNKILSYGSGYENFIHDKITKKSEFVTFGDEDSLIHTLYERYGVDVIYLSDSMLDSYTGEFEDDVLKAINDIDGTLIIGKYTDKKNSGTYRVNTISNGKNDKTYWYRDIYNLIMPCKYIKIMNRGIILKSEDAAKNFIKEVHTLEDVTSDDSKLRLNINFEKNVLDNISTNGSIDESRVTSILNMCKRKII